MIVASRAPCATTVSNTATRPHARRRCWQRRSLMAPVPSRFLSSIRVSSGMFTACRPVLDRRRPP